MSFHHQTPQRFSGVPGAGAHDHGFGGSRLGFGRDALRGQRLDDFRATAVPKMARVLVDICERSSDDFRALELLF